MVKFGQKWMYSGEVVVFGQKLTIFFQRLCIPAKWLYSAKAVVFGQKWLYSGKSGCIRDKFFVIG